MSANVCLSCLKRRVEIITLIHSWVQSKQESIVYDQPPKHWIYASVQTNILWRAAREERDRSPGSAIHYSSVPHTLRDYGLPLFQPASNTRKHTQPFNDRNTYGNGTMNTTWTQVAQIHPHIGQPQPMNPTKCLRHKDQKGPEKSKQIGKTPPRIPWAYFWLNCQNRVFFLNLSG